MVCHKTHQARYLISVFGILPHIITTKAIAIRAFIYYIRMGAGRYAIRHRSLRSIISNRHLPASANLAHIISPWIIFFGIQVQGMPACANSCYFRFMFSGEGSRLNDIWTINSTSRRDIPGGYLTRYKKLNLTIPVINYVIIFTRSNKHNHLKLPMCLAKYHTHSACHLKNILKWKK